MLRLLFGLLALALVNADYPCPPQGGAYALCATTVLYIIDTSDDLPASQITAEFNWIRNTILPGTAWMTNQKIALISYGTGNVDSFLPTGNLKSACGQLDSLQTSYTNLGSNPAKLITLMQTVELYYGSSVTTMILFSGSKDAADIKQAGDYVRQNMANKKISVIAMNGADFTGFPATIYTVPDIGNPPPNLGPCILKKACEVSDVRGVDWMSPDYSTGDDSCDINGPPDTTLPPYTTLNPNATPIPTGATTITCQCNTQTAWLDVIFLMDASASTDQDGLDAMWGTAATLLDNFNVQKNGYTGSNYYTKVGVITYGSKANLIYPLGSLNNADIDKIFNLPYNGDPETNLEAAIQMATQQFNGPNHRPNARRVMFVMAAVYDPDGVTAPQKAATTFKESDGVLIVDNFVPEGGLESTMLKEISSPGYFFSTILLSSLDDMKAALCDANCYCPIQQRSYTSASIRGTPSDGCYMEIKTPTNYPRANNQCQTQYNNATVTGDETANKTAFLQSLFPAPVSFYIGLTYDNIDKAWEWPDGSHLGSYQPWAPGTTHDGSGGLQCVYMGTNNLWYPVDCRNGYYYVCQMIPCDSVHYCVH